MKKTIILFLALFSISCATIKNDPQEYLGVDINLTDQPSILFSNYVEKGDVVVYNQPNINLDTESKVLLMPFRINFEVKNPRALEKNITRIIWQQFQANKSFDVVEYANTYDAPNNPEYALDLAKAKGANFLIGGYITQFLDGGTSGDSSISLVYEVYDVNNGNLLWSIAHSGIMRKKRVNDFFLFNVKNQMPNDPIGTVISVVSGDVAKILAMWTGKLEIKNKNDKPAF